MSTVRDAKAAYNRAVQLTKSARGLQRLIDAEALTVEARRPPQYKHNDRWSGAAMFITLAGDDAQAKLMPEDLPMCEHGHYGDNPLVLLTQRYVPTPAGDTDDICGAVAEFMARYGDVVIVRARLTDGRHVFANASQVSMYRNEQRKRRLLPGYRTDRRLVARARVCA